MVRQVARLGTIVAAMAVLFAATAHGGSAQAVTTTFTVTFLQCQTSDGSLVGTVGYFTGGPPANTGGCLATAPVRFEIVSVATQAGGAYATTDANGVAIVNLDVVGTVELFLNQNFTNVVATFSATAGQHAEFTLLLYTGSTTGSFLLTKVDFVTSQVIPGAGFVLYDPSCQIPLTAEVITDANGQALFTDLAPGNYCIIETTVPPGYQGPLVSATTVFPGLQATLGLANRPLPPPTATPEPTATTELTPTLEPTATPEPSAAPRSTATRAPTATLGPTATFGTITTSGATVTPAPGRTATNASPPAATAAPTASGVSTLPSVGSGAATIDGTPAWLTLALTAAVLAALGAPRVLRRLP
jgi:hypothetical protein